MLGLLFLGRSRGGGSFRLTAGGARFVDRQQELADFYGLSLLDVNLSDATGLRRGDFGNGLFGFHLEQDLARFDRVSLVNVDRRDIGGLNAFGNQRKLEFNRHGFCPI